MRQNVGKSYHFTYASNRTDTLHESHIDLLSLSHKRLTAQRFSARRKCVKASSYALSVSTFAQNMQISSMRFEVLMSVSANSTVFWSVTSCCWLIRAYVPKRMCRFSLQGLLFCLENVDGKLHRNCGMNLSAKPYLTSHYINL